MIDFKDLRFHSVEAPMFGGDTLMKGSLVLSNVVRVSREELSRHRGPAEREAERLIRAALWNKVYGDLVKPLREMQSHALVFTKYPQPDYAREKRIEELAAEFDTLLARPS